MNSIILLLASKIISLPFGSLGSHFGLITSIWPTRQLARPRFYLHAFAIHSSYPDLHLRQILVLIIMIIIIITLTKTAVMIIISTIDNYDDDRRIGFDGAGPSGERYLFGAHRALT